MFQEAEVAENLLRSKARLSKDASIDDLDKLWMSFDEKTDDYKKSIDQMKSCITKSSMWVCRKTPSIKQYYKMGKLIGSPGQYGICKIAECIRKKSPNYRKKYAIKIISKRKYKDKKLTWNFFQELRAETHLLAASHEHPNIINYYQVFEDIQHLYIVMNLCCGGELFDRISRDSKFSEQRAANLFRQMMSALYYIHSLGIAHCDLKPENFIFETPKNDSKILLIDFGMAKIVQWRQYHKTINGTPYYIAPEVLSGKYNESCDMWSMGVILFVMVYGFPPFHCSDKQLSAQQQDKAIFKKIKKGFSAKVQNGYGAWFPASIPISKGCRDLIARLLRSKVADRLTAEEALEHQWLSSHGNNNISDPIKKTLNSSILNSLRGFAGMGGGKRNVFQSQILQLLQKCNYLNNNQTKSVKKFFDAADKDGDGIISEEELFQALRRNDNSITKEDVHSIMVAIDADNDGCVDYNELLSSRIARKLQSNEDRLRKVFELLDFDKSGKISANELYSALESIGLDNKLTQKKCDEMVKECDENGDGEIDFEEFIHLFEKCKF